MAHVSLPVILIGFVCNVAFLFEILALELDTGTTLKATEAYNVLTVLNLHRSL